MVRVHSHGERRTLINPLTQKPLTIIEVCFAGINTHDKGDFHILPIVIEMVKNFPVGHVMEDIFIHRRENGSSILLDRTQADKHHFSYLIGQINWN
jgi:hypothetical protein